MARHKYVQFGIAAILGNVLTLGLGADASLANSGDGDNLSHGLPGRRISGGTRHSESGFRAMQPKNLSEFEGIDAASLVR